MLNLIYLTLKFEFFLNTPFTNYKATNKCSLPIYVICRTMICCNHSVSTRVYGNDTKKNDQCNNMLDNGNCLQIHTIKEIRHCLFVLGDKSLQVWRRYFLWTIRVRPVIYFSWYSVYKNMIYLYIYMVKRDQSTYWYFP